MASSDGARQFDVAAECGDGLAALGGGVHRAADTAGPGGAGDTARGPAVVVPLRYRVGAGELSLFSTTTVFGTPNDVTVAELAIESFYPADDASSRLLRTLGEAAALDS